MTTPVAAARVQLIPVPVVSPGCCALCGKSNHPKGFAAPGLHFEFYGTLYFCGDCIGDFAVLFNWIDPDSAATLIEQCRGLINEVARLEDKLGALEGLHNAIVSYSDMYPAYSDANDFPVFLPDSKATKVDNSGVVEVNEPKSTSTSKDEPESDDTDAIIAELTTVKRPDDISSNGSNESTGTLDF